MTRAARAARGKRVTGRAVRDHVSRALGGAYVDLGKGDPSKTVFVAGSGRSGTTWVSEVINHRNEYRLVFEPFDPGRVAAFRGFVSKQYLRPDDRREEYLAPAREVLTGRLRDPWADRFHRAFLPERRIVKDVRANLLLGWMRENFPGMPIVLLLRHPCAVVASRLALGWKDNLDETMRQEDLVEDHLRPMEKSIRAARDPFERHLFLWCIDNHVPLRQLEPGEAYLAFYENLLARPEAEIGGLFSYLGGDPAPDPDGDLPRSVHRALARPSPLSRRRGLARDASADVLRRRFLGGDRLERAAEILALFGLDRVYDPARPYGEGAAPDPSGVRALMGPARGARGARGAAGTAGGTGVARG